MPEATLHALADHGVLRGDTVRRGYDAAAEVMAVHTDVGVDYDNAFGELERDGLTTFRTAWAALATTLTTSSRPRSAPAGDRTIPDE